MTPGPEPGAAGAERLRRLRQWCLRLALSLAGRAWHPGPAAPVRRILVVEMTRLGDLVVASALFGPLRRAFPGAALELAGDAAYAPLFEGGGVLYHGLPGSGTAFLRALWSLRRELAGGELLVVAASPAVRNTLLVLASRPGRACGYLVPEAGGLANDAPAPVQALGGGWNLRLPKAPRGHLVERAALALRVAGIPEEGLAPSLAAGTQRARAGVVLHAGSNVHLKRWPAERFAGIARELADRGFAVSVIPAEAGRLEGLPASVAVLGRTGLAELRDLLAGAQLFIGNDTGPMHIAAAVGTPCLALFGPTVERLSGPWPLPGPGSPHRVLWEDVPCRPCAQLTCVQPQDWCMEKLGEDRVLRMALELLHAAPAPAAAQGTAPAPRSKE